MILASGVQERRAGSGPLPHPTPGPGSVHAGPDIPKSPPRPAPAVRCDPGITALPHRLAVPGPGRAQTGPPAPPRSRPAPAVHSDPGARPRIDARATERNFVLS